MLSSVGLWAKHSRICRHGKACRRALRDRPVAGSRRIEPRAAWLRLTGWRYCGSLDSVPFRPGLRGQRPARKQEGATMTYSRIGTRARGLVVAAALAGAAAFPALRGADAGPSYDGLWSV